MVPKPLYSEGFVFLKNVTVWDREIGKDVVPKNAEDLKKIMRTLNRPQEGRHALARRRLEHRDGYNIANTRSSSARPTSGGKMRAAS